MASADRSYLFSSLRAQRSNPVCRFNQRRGFVDGRQYRRAHIDGSHGMLLFVLGSITRTELSVYIYAPPVAGVEVVDMLTGAFATHR